MQAVRFEFMNPVHLFQSPQATGFNEGYFYVHNYRCSSSD